MKERNSTLTLSLHSVTCAVRLPGLSRGLNMIKDMKEGFLQRNKERNEGNKGRKTGRNEERKEENSAKFCDISTMSFCEKQGVVWQGS